MNSSRGTGFRRAREVRLDGVNLPILPDDSPRELSRFLLFPALVVLADVRKTAPEISSQIGRLGRDLDGLASGFTSQPAIQVIRRSMHAPTLMRDWHSRLRPALLY